MLARDLALPERFRAPALGYRSLGPNEDVVDRHRRNPHVSLQQLKPPRPGRESHPHRRQRAADIAAWQDFEDDEDQPLPNNADSSVAAVAAATANTAPP